MIIQLKSTANTGNVPADLANGEVALNFTDQKLFYKHSNGSIIVLANGAAIGTGTDQFARDTANGAFSKANGAVQTGFPTINVAGQSDIVADSNTDTLTVVGSGITVTTNAVSDTLTIAHPASGVTASGYGTAAVVPVFVVDANGHLTSVVNTAIAISAAAITSGTLAVARGGTGQTAITVNGSLLIGNTVSGGFDVNPITQGTGILITNDKGSITISANAGTQNVFTIFNIAGQNNVVADSTTDTLTLVAGESILITTDAANDSITFAVTTLNGGTF